MFRVIIRILSIFARFIQIVGIVFYFERWNCKKSQPNNTITIFSSCSSIFATKRFDGWFYRCDISWIDDMRHLRDFPVFRGRLLFSNCFYHTSPSLSDFFTLSIHIPLTEGFWNGNIRWVNTRGRTIHPPHIVESEPFSSHISQSPNNRGMIFYFWPTIEHFEFFWTLHCK